jgi:D-alanyl-D-alanine carboxypeptidase
MAAEMTGVSWRPGCPVALSDLRLVRLTYWGFDNAPHQGELVAHAQVAPAVVRVFGKLYAARFPIRRMRRVDAYAGNDLDSMADDNTSMFNCRNVYGSTRWSAHAFGRAIDINTVENPYLPGSQVLPPAGAAYLDRRNVRPGMIVSGDVVTQAFAAEGFRWGGDWTPDKDYQHFEVSP